MVKNSLKQNDTFLVTVEIITSDAIIVSANINSVIYRGTLIRCNKNTSCLFKNISDSQTSFSTSRLDLKAFKRQIRFKTYKSSYNLRRANNKVKSKPKIYKSEVKNKLSKNSLSIKLKKDNGVYVNTSNLSSWNKDPLDMEKSIISNGEKALSIQNRNIIKIVKTKLNSNKYEYSISNDLTKENTSQSKILKLCLTPIPDILFSQTNSGQMDIFNFAELPVQTENNINVDPIPNESNKNEIKIEQSIISHSVTTITQPKDSPKSVISNSTEKSKCDPNNSWNISKLKIVKNGSKPNCYIIKPAEKISNTTNPKSVNDIPICKINTKSRYNCKKFSIGDVVWAKLSGYSIWPAKVIDLDPNNDNATVMWLGDDYRTSQLARYKLWDFRAHFQEKFNKKGKGNYMAAVQQAQTEYSKLDCTENSGWIFDISSESSTLESVNIDDTSCELDQISLQESSSTRQNIYLPLPEEEFELMRSSSKSGLSDFLSFDSPITQERLSCTSTDFLPAKYQLNPNDINYNFI